MKVWLLETAAGSIEHPYRCPSLALVDQGRMQMSSIIMEQSESKIASLRRAVQEMPPALQCLSVLDQCTKIDSISRHLTSSGPSPAIGPAVGGIPCGGIEWGGIMGCM